MLFDSHSHISDRRFDAHREQLYKEIQSSDLRFVMDVGSDLETSLRAVRTAEANDFCYAVVGCHPHDAKDFDDDQLLLIKGLAKKPKVKAIGEIGLDYHYDFSQRDVQRHWFIKQVQLANQIKMPIDIHDREANDDVLRILKENGAFSDERKRSFPLRPDGSEDARVLLHCYSGSAQLARQYVRLGATISIAGPVTFKNARKAVEVVEAVDLSYLLIETDSPYLAPEPYRGKTNKPVYVEHVARKIAEIKNIDYQTASMQTYENACRFFNIES